jgi:putative endonuclease
MTFCVYMLKSLGGEKAKTYVGYTNDIKKRLLKHNTNKGAKSTRGKNWTIIYKRYFKTKSEAMSYEYRLKNNKKKRFRLKQK